MSLTSREPIVRTRSAEAMMVPGLLLFLLVSLAANAVNWVANIIALLLAVLSAMALWRVVVSGVYLDGDEIVAVRLARTDRVKVGDIVAIRPSPDERGYHLYLVAAPGDRRVKLPLSRAPDRETMRSAVVEAINKDRRPPQDPSG